MANTLGAKGQLVIEKPIRTALGLKPGYIAVQRLVGDHVEIRFYPPEHNESLFGILADAVKRAVPEEKWDEVLEQAWADAVKEEMEPDNE